MSACSKVYEVGANYRYVTPPSSVRNGIAQCAHRVPRNSKLMQNLQMRAYSVTPESFAALWSLGSCAELITLPVNITSFGGLQVGTSVQRLVLQLLSAPGRQQPPAMCLDFASVPPKNWKSNLQ
eukprot:3440513-Amphidinium_carterae.1